jgi:hypothetical protein
LAARSTFARTTLPTFGLPLRTLETVATDTPTAAAMSLTVAMRALRIFSPAASATAARDRVAGRPLRLLRNNAWLYSKLADGVSFHGTSVTFY